MIPITVKQIRFSYTYIYLYAGIFCFSHYISTSLRFVITSCVIPMAATTIRKMIAFALCEAEFISSKSRIINI